MTPSERFWAKVDRSGDCWLWTGSKVQGGYGMCKFGGKHQMANRVALHIAGRPVPFDKAVARHKCDTPACVNPDHLEWGTQQQNMQDAISRGRFCMVGLVRRHEELRARRVDLKCANCGCEFSRAMSAAARSKQMFCSRKCASAGAAAITHCHAGHEFTPENTYRPPNGGPRSCRACVRNAAARFRQRKAMGAMEGA